MQHIKITFKPTPDAETTETVETVLTWQDRTRAEQLAARMKLIIGTGGPHTNMSMWAWAALQRIQRTPKDADGKAVSAHTFLNYLLVDVDLEKEYDGDPEALPDPTESGHL